MASESSAFPRLNSVDRHGRKIDPKVLVTAEEIFPRALEHGLRMRCDPAVIANVLEEAAADVSRRLEARDGNSDPAPIRNLPAYIFQAFLRHVNRLKSQEPVLVRGDGAERALVSREIDPAIQLETKILMDEFLARCDFVIRDMFCRRAEGVTWEDIGKVHGLSGHAAEVRFRHAVRVVQARLKKDKKSL